MSATIPLPSSHPCEGAKDFFLKWTPRLIVATVAGYYCLGFAYELGLMAKIDQIAMPIIKNMVGYGGLGLYMPTFQWYSAWAVRALCASSAGILYMLLERIASCVINCFQKKREAAQEQDRLAKLV